MTKIFKSYDEQIAFLREEKNLIILHIKVNIITSHIIKSIIRMYHYGF